MTIFRLALILLSLGAVFFAGQLFEIYQIEEEARKKVSCEQHKFVDGALRCVAVVVRP